VIDNPQVIALRIEAERRRARLMSTAHELQDRLSPKTLAKDAWLGAKEKGANIAEHTVDAVKARPVATTGVVAAITMFLAREPLIDFAARVIDGVGNQKKARRGRKAKQDQTEKSA